MQRPPRAVVQDLLDRRPRLRPQVQGGVGGGDRVDRRQVPQAVRDGACERGPHEAAVRPDVPERKRRRQHARASSVSRGHRGWHRAPDGRRTERKGQTQQHRRAGVAHGAARGPQDEAEAGRLQTVPGGAVGGRPASPVGVDAAPQPVQPAGAQRVVDLALAPARRHQLAAAAHDERQLGHRASVGAPRGRAERVTVHLWTEPAPGDDPPRSASPQVRAGAVWAG